MHVRILRGTVQPGQLDEMVRRWEETVGTQLTQTPGFRQAYFTGNRETNAIAGVTLWDALPDPATTDQILRRARERFADITTGPPTIDDFEVLAEL